MKTITYSKKWILWDNDSQRLIRAKSSWNTNNYILEIKKPFNAIFTGLTIEDVTNSFRQANSRYWEMVKLEQAEKTANKRKKKRK